MSAQSPVAQDINVPGMLASSAGAVFSWGAYGPAIAAAIAAFGIKDGLMPLPWVGVAYLLSAVVIPTIVLVAQKGAGVDIGSDTALGSKKCLHAGFFAAVGAVCAALALATGPGAGIVMPLIFCGAPVVNTWFSLRGKPLQSWPRDRRVLFFTGIGLLITFVVITLNAKSAIAGVHGKSSEGGWIWLLYTGGTVASWGAYAPFLHAGTAAMAGSNPLTKSMRALRPVGIAYGIVMSLVVGLILLKHGRIDTTPVAVLWALLGGALGCAGALGISFGTYFGKGPVAVMPIVFGGAPFVNTVITIAVLYVATGSIPASRPLLTLVVGVLVGVFGIVLVLVYKPKIVLPARKPTAE